MSLLLLAGGCGTLRSSVPPTPSFALADAESTPLGHHFAAEAALHPSRSGFRLIVSGREAFATRVAVADL